MIVNVFWICVLCVALHAGETSAVKKRPLEWIAEQKICPSSKDRYIWQPNVPWGVEGRAYLTTPPEFDIYRSTIPGAGLGLFTKTFIPVYTWLGEYEGVTLLPENDDHLSWYAWRAWRGSRVARYVDAGELETGNWLRFVNAPRTAYEENIWMHECYGRIFYMASRDIYPGEEIFVDYGEEYAKDLNIPWPLR